jgi:linoleoyl-CoA desaturase
MAKPKFIQKDLSFTQELKKRINDYFVENKIEKTGNWNLYSKAIILVVALLSLYMHLVFFTPPTWLAIIECIILGATVAGIGFNIMHDGGHGSFSKNKGLNSLASYSLDFLGGSSFMWNMKHNVIHHTYTNIEGVDDDIEAGVFLRLSPSQKRYGFHKFQYLYFWFVYGIIYFTWVFMLDFMKYFSGKIGSVELPKLSFRNHLGFWLSKVIFAAIFILIPVLALGWAKWAIGFSVFIYATGVLIAIVFQLAHTVEHTEMVTIETDPAVIESEWMVHQLKTTANFATDNKIVNWFTGGLNFQVEHHLFPKISHVHYPAISKIIKEVCAKYEVKYNEYTRTRDAIMSHIRYLKFIGSKASMA